MPGCFGSHPEDLAMQRELDRYLTETHGCADSIDQRANDIYRAKLESLPAPYRTTSSGVKMLNFDDVIGNIFFGGSDDGIACACAVRDNRPDEAGRLLIKLITSKLRESEDESEEGES